MESSNEVKFYAPRVFIRYTGFLKRMFKGKYFVQLEGFQVEESRTNELGSDVSKILLQ